MTEFKIHAEPTETVQPGTVVRFESTVDNVTDPAVLDGDFRFTWRVIGPFSNDREDFAAASRFDFDTQGKAPGAYTVVGELVPRPKPTPVAEQETPRRNRWRRA